MTAEPLRLATFGHLYVGGRVEPSIEGAPMIGQMYVEFFVPEQQTQPWPIVMVHGGGQTGTNFTATPDGREGWAQWFVRRGYAVYVVDQVARGRSPNWSQAYGEVDTAVRWNAAKAEQRFTAAAQHEQWPQAKLQTQFPGLGVRGDPVFDQFHATQFPGLSDFGKQQELNTEALVALFEKLGGAILLTHSQSGTFGWLVADARPHLVKALVQVEPNGPPAYNVIDGLSGESWYEDEKALKPYGLTLAPLTYDPPVTPSSPLRFVREAQAVAPDLVRCWQQADPPAQLPRLAGVPIMILFGEASYHAQYEHCTSAYLHQAGVPHSFMKSSDFGLYGNGHMMMIEKNNAEVAALIHRWIVDNAKTN